MNVTTTLNSNTVKDKGKDITFYADWIYNCALIIVYIKSYFDETIEHVEMLHKNGKGRTRKDDSQKNSLLLVR